LHFFIDVFQQTAEGQGLQRAGHGGDGEKKNRQ